MQNIVVDADGHYTVLLGAARAEGLPDGLFATNDARWLGIRVESEAEQPRALLAAVPYALKAADAETLGGKPLSAFVLNEASSGSGGGTSRSGEAPHGTGSLGRIQPLSVDPASTGTQNHLAMWMNGLGMLGDSTLYQSGSNVGVGTTSPAAPLQVGPDFTLSGAWPTMGYNLYYNGGWKYATNGSGSLLQQDYANNGLRLAVASAGTAGGAATLSEAMFVASTGNVGVATTTPVAPLQVGPDLTMYGNWPSMSFNLYYNSGFKYATTNSASLIQQDYVNNGLTFSVAPSGTAGAAATPTSTLFIGGTGKVGIGTTSPAEKLDVNGNIKASGTISGAGLASFTATPTGTGVGEGTFYINPASASAGQTLFGVAVGGSQKMLVDAGGNLSAAGALSGTSLALPTTSSSSVGVITVGGARFAHTFGNWDNMFVGANAGNFVTTGGGNTGVGAEALASNTTGALNTSLGSLALAKNTTGGGNTAIGAYSLNANITGNVNTAVGHGALQRNTSGGGNSAFGVRALEFNTSGFSNNAFGLQSLSANTAGVRNNAFGNSALAANTTGFENTAMGDSALSVSSTGYDNTSVGYGALRNNIASNNVAVGAYALSNTTNGEGNTAVGTSSLTSNTSACCNTAVGWRALLNNVVSGNTAVGNQSLAENTIGTSNSAFGDRSLQSNVDGVNNAAFGSYALYSNTASNNTAMGANALQANTTGNANSALGYSALVVNSTGNNNTAIGYQSLAANTDGLFNTALGTAALQNNTANSSTAVGNFALQANTTGSNTAVGSFAMGNNTTGNANVAMGYVALSSNTTGDYNTALGTSVLQHNTASGNTAVGTFAMQANTTGSNNIAVGSSAGVNATTGSYNIYLGHAGIAAEGNTIRIGNGSAQTKAFITGIRGVTTGSADAVNVLIDSNGQLGTVSSSREVKQDIADMHEASERVMKLRPVTFRYKKAFGDGSKPIQFGLIAEEVAQTFPELAAAGASGKIETVKYHLIPVLLLNEVQRQEKVIRGQENEIRDLRKQIEDLRAAVSEIQSAAAAAQR